MMMGASGPKKRRDSGRKRRLLRQADPFAEGGSGQDPLSLSAADAALFGEIRAREGGRPNLRLLAIEEIHPDRQQPRRSLPRHLRADFGNRARPLGELLKRWGRAAAPNLDMRAALKLSGDELALVAAEALFAELLQLAASIRRDGLQHPITVSRGEGGYQLESGERRWLAFHLLRQYDDESERWVRIPANIQPERDVWRQASENSARDDLNAIARARQYALLLMDLWRERGREFRPLSDFAHEQDFYAQVREERPPYGSGARLLNAMGRQHRNAFTRCRQLLGLSQSLWERGDDENWSEDRLLRAAQTEAADRAARVAALPRESAWERQFARWQRQLSPTMLRQLPAARRSQVREWLRGLLAALGEAD